ncbi:STE/STE11/CDC15 protein kinase [Kwoniella heveanensis CBS 569]|nr:STE/STE11/CDC15 protein kinase [Kwoniella heveanensis CBS 569]
MAAAVALSNYQLGDILGRGASGSVYRALNFLTGETVAIKSISLLSLPPSSLPDIMSEIDLLKNLNHPNIVKYKGFARDKENLFIVLEYCENGSLQTIFKKFGKFPESLVSVYISQVLQGLIYLHEQGVIHRDIKGANILTNKDGSVKLADFGVSSRSTTQPTLGGGVTGGGRSGSGGSGGSLGSVNGGRGERDDNEVVGSPYWMAPEVIEQSGASTASDIWSVGCVVVELLEGKPPYGDLAPMQALWRIVQDESMKIPDGASPIVKDFLYHCFQKDPNLRVSAKKLLRHPWMLSVKKSVEPPSLPPQIRPQSRSQSRASSIRIAGNDKEGGQNLSAGQSDRSTQSNGAGNTTGSGHGNASKNKETIGKSGTTDGGTVRAKKPMTVYDEAVQRVQEWNEALNASPKALGTMRRLPLPQPRQRSASNVRQRGESNGPLGQGLFALPSRSSGEGLASHLTPGPTNGPVQPGLLGKNLHVSDVLNRAKESEEAGESWDDDFASDITLSKKLGREFCVGLQESAVSEDLNQKTLRPSKPASSMATIVPSLPQVPSSSKINQQRISASSGQVEDWSDIGLGEGDEGIESKLASLKLKIHGRKGLMHPDDIRKVPLSPDLAKPTPLSSAQLSRSLSTPSKPTTSLPLTTPSSSLPVPASPSPRNQARSPPSSRQNSLRGKGSGAGTPGSTITGENDSLVEMELNKYTEKEEEDYEDIFGGQPHASGSRQAQSLQLTRRSNKSWISDGDDEDLDPFAEIDDDFDTEDLEANLLRDKRATLCANVNKLVDGLVPHASHGNLKDGCDELLSLLENTPPEMGLEAHFVSQHGLLAVLEVLESRLSREVAVRLLKIVNLTVTSDVEMLESFCLIGGIPVIIPFTSKRHSLETRLEASTFIQQLTRSALTLQMFISCRGLRILVELLDEDYALNKTLILSSLEGISSVFELQSPTPRNDFCRMFVREGILDPLSTALLSILEDEELNPKNGSDDDNDTGEGEVGQSINTLLLFCQVAQADSRVRDAFASRTIMIRLLKACDLLPRKLLVTAIKAIKHLSTSPQLIEILQNSNAMEILVGLLGKCIKGVHANEICSHIFQTIYSMTRLSKSRQEEAASSGIIPLLKKVIMNKSPLKQFALPILCDLANAGKGSRRLLWKYDGLSLYLDLLQDPYWQVSALDAILAWMQDETARVEDVLLDKLASDSLVKCFVHASGVSFEGILDPFLKILRLSTSLTASISHAPFYSRLADTLERSTKAVIKLHLLRLTRVVCDAHPDRASLVARFGLVGIVEKLSRQDNAVLVRELAKEVLPGLLFGSDVPDPLALAAAAADGVAGKDEEPGNYTLSAAHRTQRGDQLSKYAGSEVGEMESGGRGTIRRTMSENVVSDVLDRQYGRERQRDRERDPVRSGGERERREAPTWTSTVRGGPAIGSDSDTPQPLPPGRGTTILPRSSTASTSTTVRGGTSAVVDRHAQRASLSVSRGASSSLTSNSASGSRGEADRRSMPPPPLPPTTIARTQR